MPHGGLKQPLDCRLSTIWLPSFAVNTNFILEHDVEHRVRLDPPLLEVTVDAVARLTGLMRFGVGERVQHTCPHHDR
ncbi:hypothetical protein [Streptomyces vastus]|uniref:Uncharacterized protein n=1 Tax=Streptomyces vastus TaxID=285451 RepID=A0ABN3QSJ7_9ACTN